MKHRSLTRRTLSTVRLPSDVLRRGRPVTADPHFFLCLVYFISHPLLISPLDGDAPLLISSSASSPTNAPTRCCPVPTAGRSRPWTASASRRRRPASAPRSRSVSPSLSTLGPAHRPPGVHARWHWRRHHLQQG
jgi:hypothetical protein